MLIRLSCIQENNVTEIMLDKLLAYLSFNIIIKSNTILIHKSINKYGDCDFYTWLPLNRYLLIL